MKHIVIAFSLLCSALYAYSQESTQTEKKSPYASKEFLVDESYLFESPVFDCLMPFDELNKQCSTGQVYSIGRNSTFTVIYDLGDKIVMSFNRVTKDGNNEHIQNYVSYGPKYCISKEILQANAIKFTPHVFGALTVPIKVKYQDELKVTPGGLIGLYYGWRTPLEYATSSTFIISAGISVNAVNDTTSKTPTNEPAATLAIGHVWGFKSDKIQIGIIGGYDFGKNYEPWISLGIGFNFLKPNEN